MVQRHSHPAPCGFANLATRREHFCCVHVRVRTMSAALAQKEGSLPVSCLGVRAGSALTRRVQRVQLPHLCAQPLALWAQTQKASRLSAASCRLRFRPCFCFTFRPGVSIVPLTERVMFSSPRCSREITP
jgi:hypothetical protein